MPRMPTLDPWAPVSFKAMLGPDDRTRNTLVPDWVGDANRRRLGAYLIYRGFAENVGKFFMPEVDESRREYGDAALIRDQVLSALIGDDYSIVSEGAEDLITLVKQLERILQGTNPTPLVDPTTQQPIPGKFATIELTDEEKAKAEAAKAAQEFQAWVRKWAKKQRFNMKMVECERHAVTVGDGVYTLGYDPRTKSIRLRVFDPGFYFPELSDEDDDEFPSVVHFAWLIDDPDQQDVIPSERKKRIRRITYEMVPLAQTKTRKYGTVETHTCLMSDGTWEVSDNPSVNDLTDGAATWATWEDPQSGETLEFRDVDLELGFMPVFHIPNTIAGSDHFGQPAIAHALQVLEDLSLNDTDLQASSATTGKPPVALAGGRLGGESPTYAAGQVWELEKDGKMSILDTSRSLDALLKHNEALRDRVSVNTRVPRIALGMINLQREIAGVSLRITYGPLISLIREMRQVRDEKYDLMLYSFWRMCKQYGVAGTPAEWVPSHLRLGNFLPTETDAVVLRVVGLITANAISVETGALMLLEAGIPIEDVASEVLRIQSRDFKGANLLLDATGDQAGVYEYLGRKMPPQIFPATNQPGVPNPGDPTVKIPAGQPASRGLQAQGPGAQAHPNPPPTTQAPPGQAPPHVLNAQEKAAAGARPQGAVWISGYYQTRN